MPTPTPIEVRCEECGGDHVKVVLQRDKRKEVRVRFTVHCHKCGSYSHTLPRGTYENAIEEFLHENDILNADRVQLDKGQGTGNRRVNPDRGKATLGSKDKRRG